MNQKTWSPTYLRLVPDLSQQVRVVGPQANSGTETGSNATPHPKGGVAGHGPFQNIEPKTDDNYQSQNDPPPAEPTDEELWLEDVARQVENDARPLFAATWMWLLQRALEADDGEPA